MPIEKLEEFARDGQKNTDELILTDGFPRPKFPARQWFNYLFNTLSLKINELIDLDPVSRSDIINDLKTDDSKKALSAAQGKILQDKKLEATDLKEASTTQKGITQLVNDLTSGGADKAITAEAVKQFYHMFANLKNKSGYQQLANGLILQWCEVTLTSFLSVSGNNSTASFTFPTAFPGGVLMSGSFIKSAGKNSNWGDVATWVTNESRTSATVVMASKTLDDISGRPQAKVFLIGY